MKRAWHDLKSFGKAFKRRQNLLPLTPPKETQHMTVNSEHHEKKPRSKSKMSAKIKAHALIASHIRQTETEGNLWRYDDGWDDERIGAVTGLPHFSVQYLRREMFGNVIRPAGSVGGGVPKTKEQIAEFERRVVALEVELRNSREFSQKLQHKYNALVEKLGNVIGQGWPNYQFKT